MPILPFGWPPGWGPDGRGPHAFEPSPKRATSDGLRSTLQLNATLGGVSMSATIVTSTTGTTADWLEDHPDTRGCFTAVFEGLPYIFTTASADDPSVLAIFAGTDWETATVIRSLELIGERAEKIDLWDGAIRPDRLALALGDVGGAVSAIFQKDGSASAAITTLMSDVESNTTGHIDIRDVSSFPSSGAAYIGTERLGYSFITDNGSPPDQLVTLDRAQYSPFKTAYGGAFAPAHRLDTATAAAPVVSSEPLSHLNRAVVVRFHHLAAGAWSTVTFAYTVFVGRLKEIKDDGQRLILACNDYREALVQPVMRSRYEGTIVEGMYFSEDRADMTVEVQEITGFSSWTPGAVTLSGTGAMRTHGEIATFISSKLKELANSTLIPGIPTWDASWSMSRAAVPNSEVHLYKLQGVINNALITQNWVIKIGLHPAVWQLLGWDDPSGSATVDSNGRRIAVKTLSRDDTTHWSAIADSPPLRVLLISLNSEGPYHARINVNALQGTFQAQPTIPTFAGGAQGFLKIGDGFVLAVNQVSADVFTWDFDPVLAEVFGAFGIGGEPQTIFRDDGSADGIRVAQVWLEAGYMGDLMVKLLLSTGVTDYNYSGLDVYPSDLGMAIPASILNLDEIRTHLGNDSYVLILDGPTPFGDLIESACAFRGCTPPIWVDGKITIRPLGGDSAAGEADGALTEQNKAPANAKDPDRSTATRSADLVINRITLSYQADFSGSYKRKVTVNQVTSQTDLGQAKGIDIPARGIYEDLHYFPGGAVGTFLATMAGTILAYFSRPMVVVERSFNYRILPKLFVGAKLTLTDSSVVDPATGIRGVNGVAVWVLGYKWDWSTMRGRIQVVFVPRNRVQLWAPSAQIDTSYNTAPFTRGYDAAGQRIKLKPHAYSHTSQRHDIRWFNADLAGGAVFVHVVQLSATAPTEWSALEITDIDETNDIMSLASPLAGYPVSGEFVVEFDDVLTVDPDQLVNYEFIADDADNSTGKAQNDAYAWGGPPLAVASWLSEGTDTAFPYRRNPSSAADKGEPHSAHKWKDGHDFLNTALERNTAPLLISEVFPVGEQPQQTGITPLLAVWPIPIPLFGGPRPLAVTVYARVSAGVGTVRVVTSTGPVTGTSDTSFTYPDGGAHAVMATVSSFDPIFVVEARITLPAVTGGLPPYCFVTAEISCTPGNTIWLLGLTVREAGV